MSTIVTRSGKGSPLTHTEVDNNFTNLNTDKLQSGDTASSLTITSADINGGTIDGATIGASSASSGVFTSLSDSGNLTFTGTGNRIRGDFSNATASSRVAFQTSTTNGNTVVGAIPNGTSVTSVFRAFNNSDTTNAGQATIGINNTDMFLNASALGSGTNLPMTFFTGGSERLRIDTSGNVGIGTSSPSGKLHVIGDVFIARSTSASDGAINFGSNTNNYIYAGNGNNLMAFATNGSERMRIDSSGNLLVGTTSGSARLNIVAGSQTCSFFSNTGTGDLMDVRGNVGGSSGSAMYVMPMRFGDTTLRGGIYWTGSAVQYNTSSDYRLKENIAPMTGALAKVSQLKPVTYTWKESGASGQGFIAHELQEVVPDCVTGEKDAVNEDGSIKAQGIDTSFLVATLTAAIQEQQAIINDLKARIETLESK